MSRLPSSFSARVLNKNQADNTAIDVASIIPKAEKENYEFDPSFVLQELNNRVQNLPKRTTGIKMPEQAKIPQNYWPTRNFHDPENTKTSPDSQTESSIEERKFTFVRMGCSDTNVITKTMKTPPLPLRTKRTNEKDKRNCPHYNEKCIHNTKFKSHSSSRNSNQQSERTLTRNCSLKQSSLEETKRLAHQKKFDKYYSWKYFGDTDNICGCYTAKVPSSFSDKRLPQKTISNLPNGSNQIDQITRLKYPQKTHTTKARSHLNLYERSIKPVKDQLPLPEFVLTDEENHEFDDYIDSEVDSYIQYRGKMLPLKPSTLYKLNA